MSRVGSPRWLRCSLGGLAAFAGAFVVVTAAVFVYASRLAFEVRGAPDQEKIQAFARSVGATWDPWLRVILVSAIALWVGRSTKSALLEGTVVGLVAAIAGLWLAWPPAARGVAFFVGTIVVGVIGTIAARPRPA
jgi:hypothetical protein